MSIIDFIGNSARWSNEENTQAYIVQAMGLDQSEHRVMIEASANEHTENAT